MKQRVYAIVFSSPYACDKAFHVSAPNPSEALAKAFELARDLEQPPNSSNGWAFIQMTDVCVLDAEVRS